MRFVGLAVCFFCLTNVSLGARILAIVPMPFHSHQVPYQGLWKALSDRGHEVLLISTDPIPDFARPNFRRIDVGIAYSVVGELNFVKDNLSWLSKLETGIYDTLNAITSIIFEHPDVQTLSRDPEEKFDAVIVEALYVPAFYAFAHRFNAPLIGIVSLGLPVMCEYYIGDVVLPSHPATWETAAATGFKLSFFERVTNFVRLWYHVYTAGYDFVAKQQRIAEGLFGAGLPSVLDIYKNISVIFVNEDPVMSHVRPRVPKVVQFTSFHVSKNPPALSKEVEEFIGNGTEGFLYFSFGTNAKSVHLPAEVQETLFDVFSQLPCKVLWKYEAELPRKSSNIYTAKWFPQQAVLAHPKIRLFVYHGGLQSTQEAIRNAVPMIGIPIFVDQYAQVLKVASTGAARYLDLHRVTRESLKEEIYEILNNDSYKRKAIELRDLLTDKPHEPLDNLVWWTEFVIRRKGAAHLHFSLADEPWFQRYDRDVVGFLSIVIFSGFVCSVLSLYKILLTLSRVYRTRSLPGKEKHA